MLRAVALPLLWSLAFAAAAGFAVWSWLAVWLPVVDVSARLEAALSVALLGGIIGLAIGRADAARR